MIAEVEFKKIESIPIAAVRRTARIDQLPRVIPEGCGAVWQFIRASGIAHKGHNVAIYHDDVMNGECGVVVDGPFESDGEVFASELPGGDVASVAYFGPYDKLAEAHAAIHAACRSQGRSLVRPCWEVYRHWNDDPSQLRADVFYRLG